MTEMTEIERLRVQLDEYAHGDFERKYNDECAKVASREEEIRELEAELALIPTSETELAALRSARDHVYECQSIDGTCSAQIADDDQSTLRVLDNLIKTL